MCYTLDGETCEIHGCYLDVKDCGLVCRDTGYVLNDPPEDASSLELSFVSIKSILSHAICTGVVIGKKEGTIKEDDLNELSNTFADSILEQDEKGLINIRLPQSHWGKIVGDLETFVKYHSDNCKGGEGGNKDGQADSLVWLINNIRDQLGHRQPRRS